jgi:hypothetical protein
MDNAMKPQDAPHASATAAERRTDKRRRSAGKVLLRIDASELEGEMDNLSSSGVLFFTGADLRVSVQLVENGQPVVRSGRLVRAQRVRAEHVGWAIEFD